MTMLTCNSQPITSRYACCFAVEHTRSRESSSIFSRLHSSQEPLLQLIFAPSTRAISRITQTNCIIDLIIFVWRLFDELINWFKLKQTTAKRFNCITYYIAKHKRQLMTSLHFYILRCRCLGDVSSTDVSMATILIVLIRSTSAVL